MIFSVAPSHLTFFEDTDFTHHTLEINFTFEPPDGEYGFPVEIYFHGPKNDAIFTGCQTWVLCELMWGKKMADPYSDPWKVEQLPKCTQQ
jgi:hypothetical protein